MQELACKKANPKRFVINEVIVLISEPAYAAIITKNRASPQCVNVSNGTVAIITDSQVGLDAS